ncbi:alpha/beta fold hydrolase [Spongiactinospora gelatinilytica]|uniref:alpha/beta fold hydrolase n=1 Tax=Spongiactinospora gelatinilytica TaxID=2666298 RepID=UPI001F2B4891
MAEVSRVIAPDLPGFGFSAVPGVDSYDYTFAGLADTVEAFLDRIGVRKFFVYLHDFGAPVGYHLATRHPERILGLIVQNGNAHEEGLGAPWNSARAFWADPSPGGRGPGGRGRADHLFRLRQQAHVAQGRRGHLHRR